jgi:uncharacterized protein YciI
LGKIQIKKLLGRPKDINDANNIINNDPFTMNDVLESRWIKEWMPE